MDFKAVASIIGLTSFALGFASAHYFPNQQAPTPPAPLASQTPPTNPAHPAATIPPTVLHPTTTASIKPEVPEAILENLLSGTITEQNLPHNTVSDELADYLTMSKEERAATNNALQTTLKALKAEQRLHTKVLHTDTDSTKIVIEAFPSRGKAIQAQLAATLDQSLGSERSSLFMTMTRHNLDDAYLEFGEAETKIDITGLADSKTLLIKMISGKISRRLDEDQLPEILQGILVLKPAP